jgi:hypothetical protein
VEEKGTLNLLQPNYRYPYREYFDHYTHVLVFSHASIADFLESNGFSMLEIRPRFLPLTVKSRLPVSPWLIKAYIASPIKPFAKQMLIRASASRRPRSKGRTVCAKYPSPFPVEAGTHGPAASNFSRNRIAYQ